MRWRVVLGVRARLGEVVVILEAAARITRFGRRVNCIQNGLDVEGILAHFLTTLIVLNGSPLGVYRMTRKPCKREAEGWLLW